VGAAQLAALWLLVCLPLALTLDASVRSAVTVVLAALAVATVMALGATLRR
jgi:hypothetical protein